MQSRVISLICSCQSEKAVSSASFLSLTEQPEDEADSSFVGFAVFLIDDCFNFKRSLSSHSSKFIFLFCSRETCVKKYRVSFLSQ